MTSVKTGRSREAGAGPLAVDDDLASLETLAARCDVDVRIEAPSAASSGLASVRLCFSGARVALSDSLPVIERFGLRVADYRSVPRDSIPGGGCGTRVDEFILDRQCPGDWSESARLSLEEAMRSVWRGEAESDAFCCLTTVMGLPWRTVAVLRAYGRYLRQIGFPLASGEIADAMRRNEAATVALVRLFEFMFDPGLGDRAASLARQKEKTLAALDAAEAVEDDRILRKYLMLIEATLRTNHYQRLPNGEPKPWLAFKFDSRALADLPPPCPMVEIFVYSPRSEGIHLRGGKIARGGIRWSDRLADFRTEIHGLLKAQRVKNVVIVPEGSKGGFVVKCPPPAGEAEALRREAIECYRTLIRGMLDLTDNIVDGEVVAPPDVVCRDGSDPYLVVAADKGTATFSDEANRIAAEYGFWLGDAFASGGSAGYDHKKIGITARGAWESVRQHFLEMGRDIQREEFSVIGIGDMSGDVFGNGMLLSPGIRLIGAFDHRHVFLDPNADAAKGFRERQRLFRLPHSTWADYAADALGPGGGVYARGAKSVTLSQAAREMLNLPGARTTPNEIIRALLSTPADLLWLGGIGTYVKAADESHEQVDDHACDAIRIDADRLRCKVVGEGANLGFTQKARIQYARAGGRINTDAIDNAGGVNCSDHEVNIKILLDLALKSGTLAPDARDALLAGMSEEVAALVLRDNYLQNQALSVALANAPQKLDTHQRLMRSLEHGGDLDRKVAALPSEAELAGRRACGEGLTRPELAMLLAYTKIAIHKEVIRSRLPDEALFSRDLTRYFPARLQERFAAEIAAHPLRRAIVSTMVVNGMVNRVGSGFVNDLQERTGCTDDEAMRAYAVVRDVFELENYWRAVERLDGKLPCATQVALLLEARKLVESATLWVLRNESGSGILDVSAAVARFGARVAAFVKLLPEVVGTDSQAEYAACLSSSLLHGVPAELAHFCAARRGLECALDVVALAERFDRPVEVAGRLYFAAHDALGLSLLKDSVASIACNNAMENMAVSGFVDQLGDAFARLAGRFMARADGALEEFLAAKSYWKDRLLALTASLRRGEAPSLAMFALIVQTLSALADG
jgi:glutamate dehydrogenase